MFLYSVTKKKGAQLVDVLESPDDSCARMYGHSLVFKDGLLGVGAPPIEVEKCMGAVFVYQQDGSRLEHGQTLIAPNELDSGTFGTTMAIEDDWLFVGAPGRRDDDVAGSVAVYKRQHNQFVFKQLLQHGDRVRGGQFGIAIAAVDGVLLVGSPRYESGRVSLYQLQHGRWIHTQDIRPNDEAAECGGFGLRMTAHGHFAAISQTSGDSINGSPMHSYCVDV